MQKGKDRGFNTRSMDEGHHCFLATECFQKQWLLGVLGQKVQSSTWGMLEGGVYMRRAGFRLGFVFCLFLDMVLPGFPG